jgi:hypothetical protein
VRVSTPLFSAPPPANLCKMDDPSLQDVIALLESALRAEIPLDDLPRLWPTPPADPYLAEVRGDLEFALEHIPGHRSGPRRRPFGPRTGPWHPDPELWKTSVEYDDLQAHLTRLRALQAQNR